MKLFKELPTVLPFFTDIRNQNRFKENVKKKCPFQLLSPKNAFLPFIIQIQKGSAKPTSFKLISLNGSETDLSNNIGILKAIDFEDFAYCYYKGETLNFEFETISQELNLTGSFYIELNFEEVFYYSEVFVMKEEIMNSEFPNDFIKIEFWDSKDIEPIRYRNGFKQEIYLDTFIHTSDPEIEEETENDGNNNPNTTFSKLLIKQKIEVLVPDFLKIALMTLPMHDEVKVFDQNKREGKIDRTKVTPTTVANGAFATLEIVFETDILTKTLCDENKIPTNQNLWV